MVGEAGVFSGAGRLARLGCREAPDSASLSFASPKESKQRKGDPQSGALRATCDCGQKRGSAQTRCAQTARSPDPAFDPIHRPSQDGTYGVGPREIRTSFPDCESPFCMRRGAQGQTDQGTCLSERSEFARDPGWTEHRRLPAAKRRDADSRVAFLLLTFLWRSKEK